MYGRTIFEYFFFFLGFISGWAASITKTPIEDATPAILIVVLLFILPANWNWLRFFNCKSDELPTATTPSLITWQYICANLPWQYIYLLGAGFALAHAGEESGMSEMLGSYLSSLKDLPFLLLLFLICLFTQIITEFVRGLTIANGISLQRTFLISRTFSCDHPVFFFSIELPVILPALAELAITMKIHPLYLMYPATLSCSMGFHTIFGTPHNGIPAEIANIKAKDLVSIFLTFFFQNPFMA